MDEDARTDLVIARFQEDAEFRRTYSLGDELGAGGSGRVFAATQIATGQPVAIKVLDLSERSTDTDGKRRSLRFRREVELCARLHHPNIVRILNAGVVGSDTLYSVFQYVPGITLAETLEREGPLPVRESVHLMLQVLDGLGCAHAHGVLHRDIKPQNIMLSKTGLRRNAWILDFGIGILMDPAAYEDAPLTAAHQFVGTPRYAAPEQLRRETVTFKADLYAWGVTFIEALTGRPVFEASSLMELVTLKSSEEVALPAELRETWLGELLRLVTRPQVLERTVTAEDLCAALSEQTFWPEGTLGQLAGGTVPSEAAGDTQTVEAMAPLRPSARFDLQALTAERRPVASLAVACEIRAADGRPPNPEPEAYEHAVRSLHDLIRSIASRGGARIDGRMGPRMLLHFGALRGSISHIERAAQTGLLILDEVARFDERLRAAHACTVSARVGLDIGLGLARGGALRNPSSEWTEQTVGPMDERAMALAERAPPHVLCVSEEVVSSLGKGHFVVTPLAAPAGHELVAYGLRRSIRVDASTTEDASGPLFGRDDELQALRRSVARVTEGPGDAILVTGDPGMGKSRLVEALREEVAERGVSWLQTSCQPETANTPLYPLVQLVQQWAGVEVTSDPLVARAAFEILLSRYGCNVERGVPLLLSLHSGEDDPVSDVEAPKRLEQLLETLHALVFAAAEVERPLVFVIEDLHWADPTTLRFTKTMVDDVSEAPLCFVVTARDELEPSWFHRFGQRTRLTTLTDADAAALVRSLGLGEAAPATIEKIVRRAEGVPLFLRELALASKSSTEFVEAPPTVTDVLAARLETAGPGKRLAQLASVFGREFTLDELRWATGRSHEELAQELQALVDARLLTRRRRQGVVLFAFRHALIRDAAYGSIVAADRRNMHDLVAKALREHAPTVVANQPERVAEHLAEAGHATDAAGLFLSAGRLAIRRSANVEAERHLRHGLALLDFLPDTAERAQTELGLSLALCGALMAKEGFSSAEVGTVFARARALCRKLGLTDHLLPVLFGGVSFHVVRAELDQALELAHAGLDLAENQSDPSMLLPAAMFSGGTVLLQGRLQQAIALFERSQASYVPEVHGQLIPLYSYEPGIAAQAYLALARTITGHPDRGLQLIAEALERARAIGHPHTIVHVLVRGCFVSALVYEPGLAREYAEQALSLAAEKGFPLWSANALVFRGWADALGGKLEGLRDLAEGLAGWSATGARVNVPWFRTLHAEVSLASGDLGEAEHQLARALEQTRATRETMFLADTLRVQALHRVRAGRRDEARTAIAEARQVAREQGARLLEVRALCVALEHRLGDVTTLRADLRALYDACTEGFDTVDLRRARGLLA